MAPKAVIIAFTEHGDLVMHVRTRTGERPYSCAICNKAFSRQRILVRHIITHKHTGECPYCWSTCNEAFSNQTDLQRGIRAYNGERPYPCTFCNTTFIC